MPTVNLTEVARLRLEVISFFLVAFLLSAAVLRWVWNGLARDFPRLPRLGYYRALGVVAVWGALFVLVLTMISGARELMTPGAWKKDGLTYKLADAEKPPVTSHEPTESTRRQKLDALRAALWASAGDSAGMLPTSRDRASIPAEAWVVPHPSGIKYLYIPGRRIDSGRAELVAAEPDVFATVRFGLFSDGSIRLLTASEVEAAFADKGGER
jgi:hypothetical protein